ncbi:MAG: class I SAM-dependent methyltransferase [Mesorhizobium sp.]|uniref:class I SAM-dependent methyltransferase n=2 Tax=Mesorhizobium TaxID=68287 RepID=UPI000FE8D71C|nr:class I SAM-dependent methyltransferase [Mesorhizobium sp.]RWI30042.1 MAG: class I SAM-dependent methyltransferase [Mesorhizobium sp.]
MNITEPTRAKSSLRRLRLFVVHELTYAARILYYHVRYPGDSVFSVIYRARAWGDGHSASGGGSEMAETQTIRELLPALVKELGVRSLLDAPCGDFHWMSQIDLNLEVYYGVDIVEPIISINRRNHQADNVRFSCLDITRDPLPKVDLILCRDCMVHMSNADIMLTLENFKRSGAQYLLATTYPGTVSRNRTIVSGMWRYLDLQRPPFNFPPPLRLVDEHTKEAYQSKCLGLWRLQDIS